MIGLALSKRIDVLSRGGYREADSMKVSRIITTVFFVGLLVAGAALLYFRFIDWTYPVQRKITRADGKSIEVYILGRTGDTITFLPTTTSRRYTIGISELSWKDQWLRLALPEAAPVSKISGSGQDLYIANRLKAIDELIKKREKLYNDARSLKVNWILRRKATRDIPKVDAEIRKLTLAIEEYKLRHQR